MSHRCKVGLSLNKILLRLIVFVLDDGKDASCRTHLVDGSIVAVESVRQLVLVHVIHKDYGAVEVLSRSDQVIELRTDFVSRIDGATIQIKMKNFEPESSFEDIKALTKIKEIVFSVEESPSTAYDPIDTISVQKLVFDEYDASGAYESIKKEKERNK